MVWVFLVVMLYMFEFCRVVICSELFVMVMLLMLDDMFWLV